MTDFIIPTAEALREVEQDLLPRLMQQRRIFDIFTTREVDDHVIAWEQQDNWLGLQQLRGLNGAPPKVERIGAKKYTMTPGTYGEFLLVDESEITRRRKYGTFDQMIDVRDLVGQLQMQLLQRELDRIETIGWTLLSSGTFSVSLPGGAVGHTDSYTTQTFSSIVPWATSATATPLADLRTVQLLSRGHSVTFGANANLYLNRKTANSLFSNTNSADLYGRRTAGLGTFNSPAQINQLLMGDDLPQLVVYDDGYLNDSGTFVPFISDNKAILIGDRPNGAAVAEYQMTRNANNPGVGPGAYTRVINNGDDGIPASIEVHRGHNGGPAIYWPSAVVVMTV